MIQSITKQLNSSQQSVDGGRNAYGSNAPESTVCGLLRGTKKWRLNPANREKERISAKLYRLKNKEKYKGLWRKRHLKRTYGITLEEYDILCSIQKDKCAICKKLLQKGFALNKHIDHCHKTGRVRGILCTKCNTAIAMANDDINILSSAIKYLKNFSL